MSLCPNCGGQTDEHDRCPTCMAAVSKVRRKKKSRKKFFLVALALILVLGATAAAAWYFREQPVVFVAEDYDVTGACGSKIRWGFVEKTGTLTIIGEGELPAFERQQLEDQTYVSTAPWTQLPVSRVKIHGVTAVGAYAFLGSETLTQVKIADGVALIEQNAFSGCDALAEVELGKDVITVEAGAFSYAIGLKQIRVDEDNRAYKAVDGVLFTKDGTVLVLYPCAVENDSYIIPEGVTTIGQNAMMFASAESVQFPSTLTTLEYGACMYMPKLTAVELPEGVTDIGPWAFIACEALEEVTIPDSVRTVGENAFGLCSVLEEVYYGGSELQWQNSGFGAYFLQSEIHYNS